MYICIYMFILYIYICVFSEGGRCRPPAADLGAPPAMSPTQWVYKSF